MVSRLVHNIPRLVVGCQQVVPVVTREGDAVNLSVEVAMQMTLRQRLDSVVGKCDSRGMVNVYVLCR